jgi:membrane-associated phospholipid phosphatase
MKTEVIIARVFSVALHPLIIPTLGIIILFRLNTYISFSVADQVKRIILIMVFVNTALAPALATVLLKRSGVIKDVLLNERGERLFPLLVSALFYILTYYLLKQITLPSLVYYFVIGATLLVLICLIITFRWKISIHMMSMGGMTGFLIAASLLLRTDIILLIMFTILLSGFVGAARIRLNAHTPRQVYAGFALGLLVMLTLYTYLRV